MADVLRTGQEVRDIDLQIERPDGSGLTIRVTIVPLLDGAGAPLGAVNTFQDITHQQHLEADLRDFVENATEGLHWVGADGTILWANRAELELLGYTPDEFIGHHIAEFHADPDVIERILGWLAAGQTLRNQEARLRCRDGSIRHVLINSNVLWRAGRFVHTRCFTRDVTDRKRAEDLLVETARRRDEFVLTLAHELRQPLAPLVTAIEMLKRTNPPAGGHRALEVLERQVGQVQRLVEDLLDTARIATGRFELRRERSTLQWIVRQATVTVEPLIEQGGLALAVSAPDAPIVVDVDPHRIQQVLSNLLTNAVKFTPAGGAIALDVEPRHGEVTVRVRDTGRGIPPDRLPYIFDLFVQAAPHDGGLGIGLSVVRRIVEAHGGRVEACSAGEDQGSEFIVRLPWDGEAGHEFR